MEFPSNGVRLDFRSTIPLRKEAGPVGSENSWGTMLGSVFAAENVDPFLGENGAGKHEPDWQFGVSSEIFRNAFARPEFVGWHYCGLIDASLLVPRKWRRQHSGLLDGYRNPYPALEKVLKTCSNEIYSIAQAS